MGRGLGSSRGLLRRLVAGVFLVVVFCFLLPAFSFLFLFAALCTCFLFYSRHRLPSHKCPLTPWLLRMPMTAVHWQALAACAPNRVLFRAL